MQRSHLERRVRELEKQLKMVQATQELLYEMLATQTINQFRASHEATQALNDPAGWLHMDEDDTPEQSADR